MKNKMIILPNGSVFSRLGQGTWKMGEDDNLHEKESQGLRTGIELGLNLIDTAEMYADGKAENIVGNAVKGLDRSQFSIVSKVYPQNANQKHIYSSLDCSLKLMGTNYLDMYLLHWREDADLEEVVYCMEDLKDKKKILNWGVSNFDVEDMEDLFKVPDGKNCAINQILYNLGSRGVEYDLIPWQRENNIPFMAYGPVGQAGKMVTQDGITKETLMTDFRVKEIARKHGITTVQLLLAFVLRHDDFIAIPKATSYQHIKENIEVINIVLDEEDLEQLSLSFPAPTSKNPMEKY